MTDKLARIATPDGKASIMAWGELPASEMVRRIRSHADHLRAQVAAIDACSDADFWIDIVRGSVAQHHVRYVQTPAPPDPHPERMKQ